MTMNTEDWKDAFPTAPTQDKFEKTWEKRLYENEKTASTLGLPAPLKPQPLPIPQDVAHPAAEPKAAPAEQPAEKKDAPAASAHSKHPFGRNVWSTLLLLAFVVSSVCGVMLVLKPGVSCPEVKPESENAALVGAMNKKSQPGIAWIKIRGVIAESNDSGPFSRSQGASAIAKSIRTAAADKNVKAIVLDINSPGGTVASVQNIYGELQKAKQQGKKIVALFRDVAASGGFYVAMAADKIVAEPGTITGSVGVIMQTSNLEGLFDKLGIKITPITSGKYKDMGAYYRPMDDAEKALLQDMVSETYGQFFAAVKAGRPGVKPEDLTEYTDGRVFTGERAYKLGFIDKLGGEEEARQLAGELTGLKNPKIINQRGDGLREFFFSLGSSMDSRTALVKQLETITTPSVSYLWMN